MLINESFARAHRMFGVRPPAENTRSICCEFLLFNLGYAV
jgi:hypothetical protein